MAQVGEESSTGWRDKTVTIEDVAKEANVSVATVSRALRDLPNVAPATRAKVQAVAKELSYVADPTAARLAAGRTGTVAVAVPVLDAWYFAKIVAGVEAVLKEANVDLLLYAVTSERERELFLAGRGAWWRRSDGLIMVDVELGEENAVRLAESGARIVTVGSSTPSFSSILLDEVAATKEAVEHLVAAGHTRIGVLSGESNALKFRVPSLRLGAVRDLKQRLGLDEDPELEQEGGFSVEGGRDALGTLLDLPEPPTAVFALSDEMAVGAVDCLRRRGLKAPDDMAIIGFDDNDMAELFGLTTMRQDVERVGATAARLVLASLAVPNHLPAPVERMTTDITMVVRETS